MRVLSGIQPSGTLHLGNYFGAIQQHLELQESAGGPERAFYFIANYHSLTSMRVRAFAKQPVGVGPRDPLDGVECLGFRLPFRRIPAASRYRRAVTRPP